MLPGNLWKTDAILRLFASVVVCISIGGAVAGAVQVAGGPPPSRAILFWTLDVAAVGCLCGGLVFLGRPWGRETWTWTLAFVLVFVCTGFLLAWGSMFVAGDALESKRSLVTGAVGVISFQGAALLLVWRFVREHGIRWREGFGLDQGVVRALVLGVVVGLLVLPPAWGLQQWSAVAMQNADVAPEEQEAVQLLRDTSSLASRAMFGILAILLVPVAEELLFRGILFPAIKQWGFPRLAFWGTSVLFGAIHLNVVTFLPLTALALVLAWLYQRTGNLLSAITAHSLFNAVNFVMVYAQPWLAERYPRAFHE